MHKVSTGVTLVKKTLDEFEIHCFHETTDVTFAELSDEVIRSYVETGRLISYSFLFYVLKMYIFI